LSQQHSVMLTASDFIRLPFTDDLTQAGIEYAVRSLPHTYDRMGGSDFSRLRRIVSGIAVELAFRRYLTSQAIPHDTLGATPFTDPDRYDLALGGRRCDLKSFQIFSRARISRLRADPSILLKAAALVPADQFAAAHLSDEDLYLFAFATGLVTAHQSDVKRALEAGKPLYLMQVFPSDWTNPARWASLGRLALKLEAGPEVELELGGQTAQREFCVERLRLVPHRRTTLTVDFYSLAYLRVTHIPLGRLGVYSPALRQTYIVQPHQWGNIWVYGMSIWMVGYMTRGEFRRQACFLPSDSRVLQYNRTRTPNQSVPVANLHPLADLFARLRQWAASSPAARAA